MSVSTIRAVGPSVIRTVVPIIVGVLLGWAAKIGLNLPEGAAAEIVTVAVSAGYYALARVLEQQWPTIGRWALSLGFDLGRPWYAPGDPTKTLYR